MPAIGHPGFEHDYVIDSELRHIRDHHLERGVPSRTPENLLIASWNLCNLGDTAQQRSAADLMLMAEVLKPFDLIAVQEIKDDFRQFREMVHLMGPDFDYLITDRAGNDERLGFVYNIRRVTRLQLAGELVILKHERKPVEMTVNGTTKKVAFPGFNRNPYMCAFKARQFTFTLVNVHIYYGATSGARFRRRVAEVYNLARWAHKRVTSKAVKTFDNDIILIGDFNVPKLRASDRVAKALTKFGMKPTTHSSFQGTNLSGRAQYDQIAFHPAHTADNFTERSGVFDFDKAVFHGLWQTRSETDFHNYVRYHLSDHRLLWSEWSTITD